MPVLYDNIAYLIHGHLLGILNVAEAKALQEWLDTSAQNKLIFDEVTDRDNLREEIRLQDEVDPAASLALLCERIPELALVQFTADDASQTCKKKNYGYRIAAGLVAATIIGIIIFIALPKESTQPPTTRKTTTNSELPLPAARTDSNEAFLVVADKTIPINAHFIGNLYNDSNLNIFQKGRQITYKVKDIRAIRTLPHQFNLPAGASFQVRLPGNINMRLSPGSVLTYNFPFEEKVRRLQLRGEAYFDVPPNQSRPFVVETDATVNRALGTRFRVSAYPKEKQVITSVLEGSVMVSSHVDSVLVRRGFQARLNSNAHWSVVAAPSEKELLEELEGSYHFDGGDLRDLIPLLERWQRYRWLGAQPIPTDRKLDGRVVLTDSIEWIKPYLEKTFGVKLQVDKVAKTISLQP